MQQKLALTKQNHVLTKKRLVPTGTRKCFVNSASCSFEAVNDRLSHIIARWNTMVCTIFLFAFGKKIFRSTHMNRFFR